jgi:hypothetical protein
MADPRSLCAAPPEAPGLAKIEKLVLEYGSTCCAVGYARGAETHDDVDRAKADAARDTLLVAIRSLAAPPEASGLRPEVLALARAMSAKIDGHNHDRGEHGWRTADPQRLMLWLRSYVATLDQVLPERHGALAPELVLSKAANVANLANLAMMIADVCGALAATPDARPIASGPCGCSAAVILHLADPVGVGRCSSCGQRWLSCVATPDARPIENDPCACRKAVPGMWTSGYSYDPPIIGERVRHGADECVAYVPKAETPGSTRDAEAAQIEREAYEQNVQRVVTALASGKAVCSIHPFAPVRPATCVGAYEDPRNLGFACDECCSHGNEDGWCVSLAASPSRAEP